MDFTQLLSLASKNANKQEKVAGAIKATSTTSAIHSSRNRNEIPSSRIGANGGANSRTTATVSRTSKSKCVSEDAVRSYMEQKKQQMQDKEKKLIEERRALLEQRLEKRKQAKQKEREEAMTKSLQTLKEEERRKQARQAASLQSRPETVFSKSNIRAQYSNIESARPNSAPKGPSAPVDFQTLMKMAAKGNEKGDNLLTEELKVQVEKPKKSLDEEMVHLKKVKSKPIPRPAVKTTTTTNSHLKVGPSKQVGSTNPQRVCETSSKVSTNGFKSKGIAAQFSLGSSSQSSNDSAKKHSQPREENESLCKPKFKSKGIAAQLAAQPETSRNYGAMNHEVYHRKEQPRPDPISREPERYPGSSSASSSSCGNYQQSRPQVCSSAQPVRGRGIAAQLGINSTAKRRFEERKELAELENEYDSELDDFIDDEEEDGLGFDGNGHGSADDVLAELRKITGYDPSRYNDQDISDFELRRSMTASFNDILKEEKRSERIGKKEDAEEFKKDQEKQKLKAAKRAKVDDLY